MSSSQRCLLPVWWTPRWAHSGYTSFYFEVDGAELTQGRVASGRVVEAFDIIEHVSLHLRSRAVDRLPDPLGLERGEEASHRGVVPDISGPAHRTGDAAVGHEPLELLTLTCSRDCYRSQVESRSFMMVV